MPSIKLDGKEIPFEKGDTIIRAAWRQGKEIPHYCWHPGLSVAANCRMCLVEIEPTATRRQLMLDVLVWDASKQDYVPGKKPKLEPACQVECIDGMTIKSDGSPHVDEARKHVQEYLLLNHPVDCPICDQAGECKLQDYWLSEDRSEKRMRDEIVHKPKAVEFGDTIVYDAERCIVCTRCVRFMDEIAKDPVLDKRERGNLSEIVVAPGRKLEGHYTMMTDEVCPVGALTTKDFRFKARVWFLRRVPSVCPGCATGCNSWLEYDPRTGEVPRLRPRDNEKVNKYWMCDDGIRTHRRVQEQRVLSASIGKGGARKDVAPIVALKAAAEQIKKGRIAAVLSAQRSTEDNFALAHLATTFLGVTELYLARLPDWDGDDILRDEDHNPNVRGAKRAAGGAPLRELAELAEATVSGQVTTVIALGGLSDAGDVTTIGALSKAKVITLAANTGALTEVADVLLPAASWAEHDGSFINRQDLEQHFEAGPRPAGDAIPAWEILARLGRLLGHPLSWKTVKDVRAAMRSASAASSTSASSTPAPAPAAAPAE